MLKLRSATAIIAIFTVAVSAIAILGGVDYWAVFAGFIPARISGVVDLTGALPAWITPFSSALVHGGWLHLGVNMLMLVFAGSMVERIIVDPGSPVPMVGASGAISALFGLYALFFGQPKQVTRNQKLNRWIHVLWLLVAWVALQWMAGYLAGGEGVMLATPAHIGGFIAGLLLQRPLLLWRYRKA